MKWAIGVAIAVAAASAVPAAADEKKLEKGQVPAAVIQAAAAKYPKAEMTAFSAEKEGGKTTYEVSLKTESGPTDLLISPEGKILEEEQVVSQGELPDAVKKALSSSKYGKAQVLRVEKVTPSDKAKPPRFEVVVEQSGKRRELLFSSGGKLEEDEDSGDEE